MQPQFSLTPESLICAEGAISAARLHRYMPAAAHDKPYAMRLYFWNAALCESLYLPLQTAEVCVRNVIHATLTRRYGVNWNVNHAFSNLLSTNYKEELETATKKEAKDRGKNFTIDHVVAALSFGFWVNLLTKSYEHHIWQQGIRRSFPYAPSNITREQAYQKINQLRTFRNKVAHHYAIFDKRPLDEYQNALEIIGWSSPALLFSVKNLCNPREIAQKPPRSPKT